MDKSIHSKDYAVFLRLLREARKAAGLTQADLARRLGQTQSNRQRRPDRLSRIRIACSWLADARQEAVV